ncbi:MAG: cell filamentation protein Fic, partial [Planctomycetaceae bacterium]
MSRRARPAGYLLLQRRHGIHCLPHHVESFVTHGTRRTHPTPAKTQETYPRNYWPGDGDLEHLEFALKREGLHLALLRGLLPRIPAATVAAYV